MYSTFLLKEFKHMSISSLENLHKAFHQAIKQHHYLGPDANDAKKLVCTNKKTIHLTDVFKLASEQIEESLKQDPAHPKNVSYLRTLEHDGKMIYQRYEKATKTWKRWFLKSLPLYTPQLLKHILPACFSNNIALAEQETLNEFNEYCNHIRKHIPTHSKFSHTTKESSDQQEEASKNEKNRSAFADNPNIFDPDRDDVIEEKPKKPSVSNSKPPISDSKPPVTNSKPNDSKEKDLKKNTFSSEENWEEDPELQAFLNDEFKKDHSKTASSKTSLPTASTSHVLAPRSKAEIEQEAQQKIENQFNKIRNCLQVLNQFDQKPLSLYKFTKTLQDLTDAIGHLVASQIGSEKEASFVKSIGMDDKTWDTLKGNLWIEAVSSNDAEAIVKFLQSTPWLASFQKAQKYIEFGTQKISQDVILKFVDEKGTRIKESGVTTYQGSLRLHILDTSQLGGLEQLLKFLNDHPTCRPYNLDIQLGANQSLTKESIQLLMKLKNCIGEIEVHGLQEIDFKQLALPEAEEYAFIQQLGSFTFPDVTNIVLSDYSKQNWTAQDFSYLLALCPTIEFLKECYQHCAAYNKIVIPDQITQANKLDASGISVDQLSYLLTQFSQLNHLNISNSSITDQQLIDLIQKTNWIELKGLQLKGCQALTTDILFTLANMPQLGVLSLPDLKQGKCSLDRLPKFENPFKIKMLYTSSKVTQPLASSLYTGPQIWSAVFQIPLARLGFDKIFHNQKILDPKTVAYWLHAEDYKHLKPQESITTILADSNESLNDNNLVEFIKKFPKTRTLSLYNCPHITNQGVINLLKAFPTIKILDLMECSHIDKALFFPDDNTKDPVSLAGLNKLIITATAVHQDTAELVKGEMGTKLVFEQTALKITDDDLTDDDALEKMLKAFPPIKLKYIDLQDCLKLNDAMLGKLLDYFNAPEFIKVDEKMVDNPQRLNAAVLNLKGCKNITDKAFENAIKGEKTQEKSKIEIKILENLTRIIMGGTQISAVLKQVYHDIIFQEDEQPVTIQINPSIQPFNCISYHTLKTPKVTEGSLEERQKMQYKKNYLHDRIVTELFCKDEALLQQVQEESIQIESKEFCDMTLYFKTDDHAPPMVFETYRDFLYFQAQGFLKSLRPGGNMHKKLGATITNQHATHKAVRAIIDLIYGKLHIESLGWKTAADVAELIGPNNYEFPRFYYESLLSYIHQQFKLENADELLLLTAQKMLNDVPGKELYEQKLLTELNKLKEKDQTSFQKIANLAEAHNLPLLKAKVKNIQDIKTKKITQNILDQQTREDALLAQAIANGI